MANNPTALYIHIPFCDHICSYCDFTKLFYFKKFEQPYLKALQKEIDGYNIFKVQTIYLGGGTPTSLSDEGFESLLALVSPKLMKNGEFTCEANVENLSLNKLKLMKKYGVNRLSIGIQSTCDERLKSIGRNHTYEDAKIVISKAKELGFDNINIDLIYGFEKETIDDLRNDLDEFIKLDIDHISIYSLIIEQNSILGKQGRKSQNDDESGIFYEYILSYLRKHGYQRYEVSNFARNNKFSRHNLTYWRNEEYYGCGLGASGYINNVRYTNTKSLSDYIDCNFVKEKENVTIKVMIEDFLLTNFRLESGFTKKHFFENTGLDFDKVLPERVLKKFQESGDIILNDNVRLSDKGMLRMDLVLRELFSNLV